LKYHHAALDNGQGDRALRRCRTESGPLAEQPPAAIADGSIRNARVAFLRCTNII
jgi:hypothetical protein